MKRKIVIILFSLSIIIIWVLYYCSKYNSVRKEEERIIEIAFQSALSKEYEGVFNFIKSKEFKEIWITKFKDIHYFLQEDCPKTTIFMNLNMVLFNSNKKMCRAVFTVDDLDYECGGYRGSMIRFFIVTLINNNGYWSVYTYVDQEIGSFHYNEKVYDIENLTSSQQLKELNLYSKEDKRKYLSSVGIDYFAKTLVSSETKPLIKGIDFIWDSYWFDK